VGSYAIIPSGAVSLNYSFVYVNGSLSITPAALTVKADDKVIFKGDQLPAFTSSYTGFRNNDQQTIVTVPTYTLNPTYLGNAGVYTIKPSGLVLAKPANYTISYVDGYLYVNPKGNGASKVRPKLDCIEEVTNHPSGFRFIAHFSYYNPNSTLYVLRKRQFDIRIRAL
jgi:hypothetical protein